MQQNTGIRIKPQTIPEIIRMHSLGSDLHLDLQFTLCAEVLDVVL